MYYNFRIFHAFKGDNIMNSITVTGNISNKVYSHNFNDTKFYNYTINVKRDSGVYDELNVLSTKDIDESHVSIDGEIRSHNYEQDGKIKTSMFIYEKYYQEKDGNENTAEISGYICKKSSKRYTPNGKLIVDFIIAVNRPYGKTDYIQCITWGSNCNIIDILSVGSFVKVNGRFQSRKYMKKDEEKTAYELSVNTIEVI